MFCSVLSTFPLSASSGQPEELHPTSCITWYVQEVVAHWIAECRLMIEQTRLLTLHAAHAMDTRGSQAARKQVKVLSHLTAC